MTPQTPQIKNHFRVITPEEYDDAVRPDPLCSPLTATADHWSGHQFLADVEADFLRTIAGTAASRDGRAELDAIAVAMEAFANSLKACRHCLHSESPTENGAGETSWISSTPP
jgi:hypothetical protein